MRHAVAGYKLNRDSEHRRAMFRNLAAGLFQHGQITTTLPKAKAVQPFVERLITLAKKGDLNSRRRALSMLPDRFLVETVDGYDDGPDVQRNSKGEVTKAPRLIHKLFSEIGPKFADRPGGYTRIIKLAKYRIGDAGDLVVLQLVGEEDGPSLPHRASSRRKAADKRTAFAAKLRKGGSEEAADEKAEAQTEAAPEATEEEATAEASEETKTEEAPAEEATPEEASKEEAADDASDEEEKKEG